MISAPTFRDITNLLKYIISAKRLIIHPEVRL